MAGEPTPVETIQFGVLRTMMGNGLRLMRMVLGDKPWFFIALALVWGIIAGAPFIGAWIRGVFIDHLISANAVQAFTSQTIILTSLMLLVSVLPDFLNTIQLFYTKILFLRMEEKLTHIVIKKAGEIDVASYEDPKFSDLVRRVKEEGIWRAMNFIENQIYILQNLLTVVIAAFITGSFNGWILLLLILGAIPEMITELRYGNDVWGIENTKSEVKRRYWDARSHFEHLPMLIELKLFQNTAYFLAIIRDLFSSYLQAEEQNERTRIRRRIISLVISQATIGIALFYFVSSVIHGKIQVGEFLFIFASLSEIRSSLSRAFSSLARQYQWNLFVTDFLSFIDTKPLIIRARKPIALRGHHTPRIEFRDVSFVYPGTSTEVLRHVSFTIAAGERLAIVGLNGAGKSTIVKLLCRFYDPTSGQILIDGNDLRRIDLNQWYAQVGALFQDYGHYHLKVKDAIAIGRSKDKVSNVRVYRAAKVAEADQFIQQWEKTYDQMLGKQFTDGVEPSIGQWQKLALARVFYRNPRVYIFDEPTSSIDPEAEAKIFDRLAAFPRDRTMILISHRFSTVRQADHIIVLAHGRIHEQGSHLELLQKKGTYARLFRLQAKGYR